MKFLAPLSVLVFLAFQSNAQLVVDNTVTPEQAVEDILIGEGVEIFNITFSGDMNQIGSFDSQNSNIPLPSGVVIATGDVNVTVGPNQAGGSSLGGGNFDASDPDLEIAEPNFAFNDAAVLEFDFVATGDSISFRYVWSSEEYPEFVNSSFNDAFGFFLSGPGIDGPFTDNGINIALVPGTTLPITIDNVNAGTGDTGCNNCEFYVINTNNGDPNGTQMDGFTVSLRAEAGGLICGETYHIKIAIADAGDTAWDSAVFLEAGSFESNEVQISATIPDAPPNFPELTLLEGCVDGFVTIFRPVATEAETILVITGGTATPGDDYEALPETVEFEAGQQTVDLPITTIFDGIEEDTETITVTYDYVNACDEEVTVNIVLNILDYNLPELDMDDVFLCDGEDVVVNATPTNGFGPFTYSWSTGQASPSVTVSGGGPDSIFVDIEDYCGSTAADSFRVSIPEPITFPEDTRICFGEDASMSPLGGAQPYTFIFPEDSLLFENTIFTPVFEGEYLIEYIDNCGITGSSILEVSVCETVIPNVFTPNGDGVNDLFLIQGAEGFPNSRLEVYNRWGNIVYEDDNYRNTWRAEDVADGTYYYIYFREDGEKFAGHVKIKRQR